MPIDSFRYLRGVTKRMVRTWIKMEEPRPIPWTPLTKPLSECKVAMISSGGIARKDDLPFDQEGERQNPWWGDPSFRVLPAQSTERDLAFYHLHVDFSFAKQDINAILPFQRLSELAQTGEIGQAAEFHYSVMGYLLEPEKMLEESVPKIIDHLRNEAVDVVLLVPF